MSVFTHGVNTKDKHTLEGSQYLVSCMPVLELLDVSLFETLLAGVTDLQAYQALLTECLG